MAEEKQELLPMELRKKFEESYPLYSQEENGNDATVVAHWFLGGCDWWATEGSPHGDDFRFFGVVNLGFGAEFGYFSLSQISETFNMKVNVNGKIVRVPMHVERDEYWHECKVSELETEWD